MPRTRKGFQTQVFERYHRRQAELDQGTDEMFVQGVSARQVGEVMEALTDVKPSPATVSRVFHTLGADLAIIGINLHGEREVLGFTVGERENQAAWEDL